jgi:hypothetical protein
MTVKEMGWKKGDEFDWLGERYRITYVERRIAGVSVVHRDCFDREYLAPKHPFHVRDLQNVKRVEK